MEASIVRLLLQAKSRTGLDYEAIAKASGLVALLPQKKQPGAAIRHTVNAVKDSIYVCVADWALAHTVAAADPLDAALAQLENADLSEVQLQAARSLIATFRQSREALPPFTSVKQVPGAKLYEPPPAAGTNPKEGVAGEAPGAYASKIEEDAALWARGLGARVKPHKQSNVDLRRAKAVPHTDPLQVFDEQAAAAYNTGGGKALGPIVEETEPADVRYPRASHFILKVTGDSMAPDIKNGDEIIVRKHELYLPPWDENQSADPKPWQALDNKVVVAMKNEDEFAVVKRLVFGKRRGGFRIDLLSDNRKAKPVIIEKEDTLRVIGVVVRIMRDPDNAG